MYGNGEYIMCILSYVEIGILRYYVTVQVVKKQGIGNNLIMDVVIALRLSKANFATTAPVKDEEVSIWRR
jgi:hypothetical protein